MKRVLILLACLCLLICMLPCTAFATDNSRNYQFDLSIAGEYEVTAVTDEVLTATLTLRRTDRADSAEMYGMQTELWYDDSFFQLVENSVMTVPGVEWRDMARRTGGRAFYLNFVSFSGGETWDSEIVVGTFQLKVIAGGGVSAIFPENSLVSTKDGKDTFAVSDNSVNVIISTECTVTFEENGGNGVPDQIVQYGEKVQKPDDPAREGYHFEGWYSNLDCTQLWDFENDTVKGNMTLYAGWSEAILASGPEAEHGGFPWWILLIALGAAALLIILFVVFGKKKVTFETYGGTELEPVYVKKNSTVDEPMTPVKAGAMFLGWYRDPEFTQAWNFAKDTVNGNTTLYARWR